MMSKNVESTLFRHIESRRVSRINHLLNEPKVLAGHFFLRDFSARLLRDTYVFTFLRNPVDRVISQYHYYRGIAVSGDDPEVIAAKNCGLEEILARPGNNPRWVNAQTSCLSGETRRKTPDGQSLKRAVHNIRLLDFVGLYEQLQASWSRLAKDLGWGDFDFPLSNQTRGRPRLGDLDSKLTGLIAEKNALDVELYEKAQSLFGSDHKPPADRHELLQIDESRLEFGTRDVFFTEIKLVGRGATSPPLALQGEMVRFRLTFKSATNCQDLTVGISIRDDCGVEIYGTNSRLQGHQLKIQKDQTLSLDLMIKLRMSEGLYSLEAALGPGRDSPDVYFHWIEQALQFRVVNPKSPEFAGLVDLEGRFESL